MNKLLYIFMVLLVNVPMQVYGQCGCGSSSSSSVISGETGQFSVSLLKKQWLADGFAEFRDFKTAAHEESGTTTITDHHHNNETENGEHSELKSTLAGVTGLRYGFTDWLTVGIQVPYLSLNATPSGANGMGDVMVQSIIKVYEHNNWSAGCLAGVKIATGKESTIGTETNSVIGTGSYDPVAGVIILKAWHKLMLRGTATYKLSANGYRNTNYGDYATQNISIGYLLKGDASCCSTDSLLKSKRLSWAIYAGMQHEWMEKAKTKNLINPDTGGSTLYTSIGTAVGIKSWWFPVAYTIPVIQQLNGEQRKTSYRLRIGISKYF